MLSLPHPNLKLALHQCSEINADSLIPEVPSWRPLSVSVLIGKLVHNTETGFFYLTKCLYREIDARFGMLWSPRGNPLWAGRIH